MRTSYQLNSNEGGMSQLRQLLLAVNEKEGKVG
jgi:hypothetical protein